MTYPSQVLLLSIGWGVGVLAVFQIFGGVLPLIFTSDKQVIELIFFLPVYCLLTSCWGLAGSCGFTVLDLFLGIVVFCGCTVYLPRFGRFVVFCSFPVSFALSGLAVFCG